MKDITSEYYPGRRVVCINDDYSTSKFVDQAKGPTKGQICTVLGRYTASEIEYIQLKEFSEHNGKEIVFLAERFEPIDKKQYSIEIFYNILESMKLKK